MNLLLWPIPPAAASSSCSSAGERSAGELVEEFDVSAPAISQHLKALRDAGSGAGANDAQRRIYALDAAGLENIDAWLKHVRKFWSPRLDALERELRKPASVHGKKQRTNRRKR